MTLLLLPLLDFLADNSVPVLPLQMAATPSPVPLSLQPLCDTLAGSMDVDVATAVADVGVDCVSQ